MAFGCENLGLPRDEIWPRVRWALDAVGLDVPIDRATADLSGGQRQRLALAGALAMRPQVLLLDEPTANLDPAGVEGVRDAVKAVLDLTGATLVVVEHRVSTWLPLVDRIVVIAPEGVIADGSPEEVLEQQGAALAARGIWVPSFPPQVPRRRNAPGDEVLTTGGLVVGRDAPVQEVDVTLREGELLAVTGPNGVGKSTLGLTLGGLLPPLAGTVTALGRADPHRWRSRELLGRIGSVFQDPEHQFLTGSVREEVEVGPKAVGRPADVDALLERLDLAKLARANPVHALGGRTAAAQRRDGARNAPAHPHPRRADLRTGLGDLGAAGRDHRGARRWGHRRSGQHARPDVHCGHRRPNAGAAVSVNPAAKLIAAALLAVCLVLTLDVVSAGTAVVLELLLLPLLRIPPKAFWLRTIPPGSPRRSPGSRSRSMANRPGTCGSSGSSSGVSDGSPEPAPRPCCG